MSIRTDPVDCGWYLRWFEFDFAGETVLKDELPMFPNLKHLKLNGDAENYWNNLLLPFLNCSPVLETLEFAEGLARNHGDTIGEDGRMALEREFFTSDQEIPLCC
uniref:Uncharacterized protein n=1 Tax=Chenopodium quinoa TaxID=63459 RepID=A0A803M6C8_CHEQI